MKANSSRIDLPIGRAALLALHIEAVRGECCSAAAALMRRKKLDYAELEECARLDDALAAAHRILKANIGGITLSRLRRRSQSRTK